MFTLTAGFLPPPSPSTPCSGTSMPVAVLPDRRIVLVNFMAAFPWWIRSARGLRDGGQLCDADVVAERIAQPEVDAVGLFGRLLGELDAALGAQLLIRLARVGRCEEEVSAGAALGQQ